jgi:hypothetical protein
MRVNEVTSAGVDQSGECNAVAGNDKGIFARRVEADEFTAAGADGGFKAASALNHDRMVPGLGEGANEIERADVGSACFQGRNGDHDCERMGRGRSMARYAAVFVLAR